MDILGGDQPPLFSATAVTDVPELTGDAVVADGGQRQATDLPTPRPGRLFIGSHFSGAIAAGQTHARELLDNARRLHASIQAGSVAVQAYGQSVAARTARTLDKAGSMIRSTPEAVMDGLCLAAMGGLALMGATDWDTRRDRLERYTLLPGEQPHYWGAPHYPPQLYSSSTPITSSANWQPARSHTATIDHNPASAAVASPASYQHFNARDAASGMPAWLLPLYQHEAEQETERDRVELAEEQADLVTRYLAQFLGGSGGTYAAVPSMRTLASRVQRTGSAREQQTAPSYRRIRVRVGAITMALSGPADDIYGRISAWQSQNSDASIHIITDEPMLV